MKEANMVKVRFAPSPTGYIHIGNTRIALFNWLYSLQHNGEFVLRYDDTDIERSKQEYIDGIASDLAWLGIKPTQIEYQSKRFDRYNIVVEKLKADGVLYPCYETPSELDRRRKILLSRRLPPVYGREALKLTNEEIAAYQAEGRKPHWRFLLPNFEHDPFSTIRTEVHWDDEVRGRQTIDLASVSDPVLIREDRSYLYTLPSVIDDIDMGITHIIRGDDHVTNTAVQLAIFDALGAKRPRFGHINLLTTKAGGGLSKRKGDLSVYSLREEMFEPMAIASLAVLIGTSENVRAYSSLEELAEHFTLTATSHSPAKFDPEDLLTLNRELVHAMPYEKVADRLMKLGIGGRQAEQFWNVVRGNLVRISDAPHWWRIVTDRELNFLSLCRDELGFLAEAVSFLPAEPWDEQTWKLWTTKLKEKTGRKGKDLFKPLRLALTGQESGPELAYLLPLIGHDYVQRRLGVL